MKFRRDRAAVIVGRRSPCGERGLKCRAQAVERLLKMSLPVRGAWVEILHKVEVRVVHRVAPRAGSVG